MCIIYLFLYLYMYFMYNIYYILYIMYNIDLYNKSDYKCYYIKYSIV